MKTFHFGGYADENEKLVVEIPERVDPAYGMYVWPCAVVLAQYIWFNRKSLLKDKHLLEIGAGTSLPGIVASMCSGAASVTLTDDIYQPESLKNCELSCTANSIPFKTITTEENEKCYGKRKKSSSGTVKIAGLHWGEIPPMLFTNEENCGMKQILYPDVILGSDCFFDETVFEKILFTVFHLFEGRLSKPIPFGVTPTFLCTMQVRSTKSSLDDLLQLWNLKCRKISLSSFAANACSIARSNMPGNHKIQMLEITPNITEG